MQSALNILNKDFTTDSIENIESNETSICDNFSDPFPVSLPSSIQNKNIQSHLIEDNELNNHFSNLMPSTSNNNKIIDHGSFETNLISVCHNSPGIISNPLPSMLTQNESTLLKQKSNDAPGLDNVSKNSHISLPEDESIQFECIYIKLHENIDQQPIRNLYNT